MDPVSRNFQALIGASLVCADRHRHTTLPLTQQGVADKARHFAQRGLDVGLVLLQNIEKLLSSSTRIGSYDCMHVNLLG